MINFFFLEIRSRGLDNGDLEPVEEFFIPNILKVFNINHTIELMPFKFK